MADLKKEETCASCNGQGYVTNPYSIGSLGMIPTYSECSHCNGAGKVVLPTRKTGSMDFHSRETILEDTHQQTIERNKLKFVKARSEEQFIILEFMIEVRSILGDIVGYGAVYRLDELKTRLEAHYDEINKVDQ